MTRDSNNSSGEKGDSLIEVSDLTGADVSDLFGAAQPATALINRLFDAAGYIFGPVHEVLMSGAEAVGSKTRVRTKIELAQEIRDEFDVGTDRALALTRFLEEETIKQSNRDAILEKALPRIDEDANPNELDDEWILSFLDSCELTSDEELQLAWSKILSGEVSNPGTYSKRTLFKFKTLETIDAELFKMLCVFSVDINGNDYIIITNIDGEEVYSEIMEYGHLLHLEEVGLIRMNEMGYRLQFEENTTMKYEDTIIEIESSNIGRGYVKLTGVGRELHSVVDYDTMIEYPEHLEEFYGEKYDDEMIVIKRGG